MRMRPSRMGPESSSLEQKDRCVGSRPSPDTESAEPGTVHFRPPECEKCVCGLQGFPSVAVCYNSPSGLRYCVSSSFRRNTTVHQPRCTFFHLLRTPA